MANAGFGFVGFCLMVAWLVLISQAAWKFRMIVKDRFEYVSVAVFPMKAATMFCVCMFAFWRLALGELWWFHDAQGTTVAALVTFFIDGMSRPAVLAFVSLIWARGVSSELPTGCTTADTSRAISWGRGGEGDSSSHPGGSHVTAAAPAEWTTRSGGSPPHASRYSDADHEDSLRGGAAAIYSPRSEDEAPWRATAPPATSTKHRGGGGRPPAAAAHYIHLNDLPDGDDTREGYSNRTSIPRPVSSNTPPPLRANSTLWEHALAYVDIARAYVLGDEGHGVEEISLGGQPPTVAKGSSRGAGQQPDRRPWEQSVRWRLVLGSRWIACMLVAWSGLYVGLLTWTSSMPVVACTLVEDPESTGCYEFASGNHIVYIEPRVYTVVSLLTNSFLIGALVWSGISHLERVGHARGRRVFRSTLLWTAFFQSTMIVSLFCRIFDTVRFNGGRYVFFCFLEDIAMMGLLGTLTSHMKTAAKRRATGPVAESIRHTRDQIMEAANVAVDRARQRMARWWAHVWRIERSTEPHAGHAAMRGVGEAHRFSATAPPEPLDPERVFDTEPRNVHPFSSQHSRSSTAVRFAIDAPGEAAGPQEASAFSPHRNPPVHPPDGGGVAATEAAVELPQVHSSTGGGAATVLQDDIRQPQQGTSHRQVGVAGGNQSTSSITSHSADNNTTGSSPRETTGVVGVAGRGASEEVHRPTSSTGRGEALLLQPVCASSAAQASESAEHAEDREGTHISPPLDTLFSFVTSGACRDSGERVDAPPPRASESTDGDDLSLTGRTTGSNC